MRPLASMLLCSLLSSAAVAESLPFEHRTEVYRDKQGDVIVFALRLKQPFLAEEFEQSRSLRLESSDGNAWLIYPTETRFEQKHAEFYGRLRGDKPAKLRLTYETVTENPDGSRRVETHHGDVEIAIPQPESGPRGLFSE